MVTVAHSSVNRMALLKSTIERAAQAMLRFCLPPTCFFCGAQGRILQVGRAPLGRVSLDLCEACERDLPRAPSVPRAAEPWRIVVAPFRYAFPVDHCVRALKFERELAAGRLLAVLLARERQALASPLPDLVLPVPLHRARLVERGFNQAAVIAQYAARRSPVVRAALTERCRATAEQATCAARRVRACRRRIARGRARTPGYAWRSSMMSS